MKTRYSLAGTAVLVLGGFVCALLGDSSQAQVVKTRVASRSFSPVGGSAQGCPNPFQREPVLVYDKTGGTLLGAVHEQLTVYRDGLATYSRIDPLERDGQVSVRTLSPAEVDSILNTLLAVGAQVMCDDPTQISDVPLATLTVLQGDGPDAAAHSFSYYAVPTGGPALVESILRNFIAAQIEGT